MYRPTLIRELASVCSLSTIKTDPAGPSLLGEMMGGASATCPPISNIKDIAVGWGCNLALKDDGTVVAWGDNSSGQCKMPKKLKNVTAIAAGWGQSLAIKTDGTLVGWGGIIGPLTTSPRSGIQPIPLMPEWYARWKALAIAAGPHHCLAIVAEE